MCAIINQSKSDLFVGLGVCSISRPCSCGVNVAFEFIHTYRLATENDSVQREITQGGAFMFLYPHFA